MKMRSNRVFIGFLIVAIAIFAITFSYYFINTNSGLTKSEINKIVFNLQPDSVDYFLICPTDFHRTIVNDTIYVRNAENIRKLCLEIKKMKKYSPNHPSTVWNAIIKVKLKSKETQNFFIEITQSDERNGTCLWIMKENKFGKFNLGEYRNDNLGKLIETIVLKN